MAGLIAYTAGVSGLDFVPQDAVMTLPATTAATKGQIWSVVPTTVDGSLRWTTLAAPATADFSQATNTFARRFFCVALQDVAAPSSGAATVRVRFRGVVDAQITTTSVAIGDFLRPTDSGTSQGLSEQSTGNAGGILVVAQALEANTVAGAVKKVLFDGIDGFGVVIT